MAKRNSHVPVLAQLFHIMGDETRLNILIALQTGEKNVTSLVKKLKMPQSTVSHHLALMRMASLVATRRSGKEIFYSINDLDRHKYARALKSILKDSAAVQMGQIVLGLAH